MKSACIFIYDGFNDLELFLPAIELRSKKFDTTIVSVTEETTVVSLHNLSINTDCTLEEIKDRLSNIDMFIIPGGPAASNLSYDTNFMNIIKNHIGKGKAIATIGRAVGEIIGKLNIDSDIKIACPAGFEYSLRNAGINLQNEHVITDKNFITAKNYEDRYEFAEAIIKYMNKY